MPAVELDGGDRDCGSGLLLAITAAMRRVPVGGALLLHTREPSVLADLPAWARLAGHTFVGVDGGGPWRVAVRRGEPRPAPTPAYTEGGEAPLGTRLWLYTNFSCNLACGYCCAESSPSAAARLMPPEVAAAAVTELAAAGGQQVLLTGGEPFLHPRLDAIVAAASALLPVTILTNGMVYARGARRATLEGMDRARVTLQVSLDSADPALHDTQRGAGSHARALAGITLARELGFPVRIAATLYEHDLSGGVALHALLDRLGIPPDDRLVRPVARQGFAGDGVTLHLEDLAPEPTITADGAWWHPVSVADPAMRISGRPLPVSDVLAVMADLLAVRAAADRGGRRVFRCT